MSNNYTYHYKIHPQKRVGTYERNQLIKQLRSEGKTFTELGELFHITRQRAQQIVSSDKGVNDVKLET